MLVLSAGQTAAGDDRAALGLAGVAVKAGARSALATLWYKHGFYSKIELMTLLNDHDKAEHVMRDFLTSALPSIEQCMPDWKKVEGK